MKTDTTPLYVCVMSFDDAKEGACREGDRVRGSHPLVKNHPNLFIPDGSTTEELHLARLKLFDYPDPPVVARPSPFLPPEKTRRCIRGCQFGNDFGIFAAAAGDIVPATSPLVTTFPAYFEKV